MSMALRADAWAVQPTGYRGDFWRGCTKRYAAPSGLTAQASAASPIVSWPLQSIAGHVTTKMLDRYSHVRREAKRRALEAVEAAREEERRHNHFTLEPGAAAPPSVAIVPQAFCPPWTIPPPTAYTSPDPKTLTDPARILGSVPSCRQPEGP